MNEKEALEFMREVFDTQVEKYASGGTYLETGDPVHCYERSSATKWLVAARTAMESIFPPEHPVRKQWERVAGNNGSVTDEHDFEKLRAVFEAALELLEQGRVTSLVDGVREEAVSELLDQAAHLGDKNYLVAAAVLAGGALESHLRHLCIKNALQGSGNGSISNYDAAIAVARKAGTMLYSPTDSKLILGWGGLRNDAAHQPTTFSTNQEEVRLMIEGIRQFIGRSS